MIHGQRGSGRGRATRARAQTQSFLQQLFTTSVHTAQSRTIIRDRTPGANDAIAGRAIIVTIMHASTMALKRVVSQISTSPGPAAQEARAASCAAEMAGEYCCSATHTLSERACSHQKAARRRKNDRYQKQFFRASKIMDKECCLDTCRAVVPGCPACRAVVPGGTSRIRNLF